MDILCVANQFCRSTQRRSNALKRCTQAATKERREATAATQQRRTMFPACSTFQTGYTGSQQQPKQQPTGHIVPTVRHDAPGAGKTRTALSRYSHAKWRRTRMPVAVRVKWCWLRLPPLSQDHARMYQSTDKGASHFSSTRTRQDRLARHLALLRNLHL